VASNDLIFSQAPLVGTPNLVFGGSDTAPIPDATLSAAGIITGLRGHVSLDAISTLHATGVLSGLRGHVSARTLSVVHATGTLSGLRGHALAAYDNRLVRYLDIKVSAPQNTAIPARPTQSSEWGISLSKRGGQVQPWGLASAFDISPPVRFTPADAMRTKYDALWNVAAPRRIAASSIYQKADRRLLSRVSVYETARHIRYESASGMQTGSNRRWIALAPWQQAGKVRKALLAKVGASSHRTGRQAEVARWQKAQHPPAGREALLAASLPPADLCYLPDTNLLFNMAWSSDLNLFFICERTTTSPIAGVVVPLLRIYVTINSISLRRVDGDIPIPAHSFSMSLDADSWTWSWSASVPASALALVQPGSNGDPVEIEALVNGVPYRLCAEGIGSQRQFGQARISVQGRGTAAILDAPYAPVLNHGNSASRTAQQLMTDVLTVNGVGIGWAVDWGLTDWLVPGNTWTHQGAYISAILDIAQAAGGYVQPHNTAQTLRILPRYPAAPWNWGTIVADFELPSAVVAVEGIDWLRKPAYNRVHVSGTANGVLGEVTRAGTAGNSVAPMVTDSLITHADAARQRGLAELSDTGTQARITLKLPVLAETGLITPGKFVRYLDGSTTRLGLVRGTSLDWSSPKLRQSISVETHTA
jgi:hypothetical protein